MSHSVTIWRNVNVVSFFKYWFNKQANIGNTILNSRHNIVCYFIRYFFLCQALIIPPGFGNGVKWRLIFDTKIIWNFCLAPKRRKKIFVWRKHSAQYVQSSPPQTVFLPALGLPAAGRQGQGAALPATQGRDRGLPFQLLKVGTGGCPSSYSR